jgi:2-amino-4-hydroxy-6-hydroxymethyldihydropteridine diphosphokinase
MKYHLSLGANIGDLETNLAKARARLEKNGVRIVSASSLYRTEPVGCSGHPWFLNQVIEVETDLIPRELLGLAKRVERAMNRLPGPPNAPRPIDIDILLSGETLLRTERLTIPHPRLTERNFVLIPLAEIAPGLVHPVFHETIETLRRQSEDQARVERFKKRL